MSSAIAVRRILALPPALRRQLYSTASTTPASSPELYDIVCIGGGPVGLSLLSALRSSKSTKDLKVALIDAQDLSAPRNAEFSHDQYSNRCSSLTPSSLRFLRGSGAWDEHVAKERAQPYHAMDVWDGVSGRKVHFDPSDSRAGGILDEVARIIPGSRFQASSSHHRASEEHNIVATMCENTNLQRALLRRVDGEVNGVEVIDNTKVQSIEFGPEPQSDEGLNLSQWPVVTTQSASGPRSLAARLLVGADGANSPVRRFADIPSHGWDYNQHGVVATLNFDPSISHGGLRTAYQRFLPTGPVALLPLPDNRASLVWSTTPQHAARLKALMPEHFTAMVNAAFRLMSVDINFILANPTSSAIDEVAWREPATPASSTGLPATFPRIESVQPGSVASFPLRMRHASTYTGHRVALIGDAAHTIHPLAGQGLNLGLADAEALAKYIVRGVEHGMDIGSCWCLDDYNSERWAANNAMMGTVDKLNKLYSAASGPVVWGRSLGLELVDKLGPLKGMFMGAAGGGR